MDTSELATGRWFGDGVMNTSYMALDHHVNNGRGDQVAIHYDSPVTGSKSSLTYSQLLAQVALFGGVLTQQGVAKGDRVVIYMPMVMEAAIAMLACAMVRRPDAVHRARHNRSPQGTYLVRPANMLPRRPLLQPSGPL